MWKLRAERFRAWPTEEAKANGSVACPKGQDRGVRGSAEGTLPKDPSLAALLAVATET